MTVAPIVREAITRVPPERAFTLFTGRMGDWWGRSKTIGAKPHEAIVIEERVGGRWFERDEDGRETYWGEVLDWDPPNRVLLAWRIGSDWTYHPDLLTEVEILFQPTAEGRTRVRLEHRRLENLATPEPTRAQLDGGWPAQMAAFTDFAETQH